MIIYLTYRLPLQRHESPVLNELQSDVPPLPPHLLRPGRHQGNVLVSAASIGHHIQVVTTIGHDQVVNDAA